MAGSNGELHSAWRLGLPCASRLISPGLQRGSGDRLSVLRSVMAPVGRRGTITINEGEHVMSKGQDAKKNTKKAPSKTPKEKKEAKRLKKAEKKH